MHVTVTHNGTPDDRRAATDAAGAIEGHTRNRCAIVQERDIPSQATNAAERELIAKTAIDAVTRAMSLVSSLEMSDDTLTAEAHSHLTDARRALLAKYQPNVYPHGMD
ncbi:hypothetical protein FHT44_005093 [Mycolicibacterium sp. BK634]|uniref:hypothetical protein n=1 Tax=Mycolicibacterium sp. BK634 TaxID=2587099 RepID=UPI001614B590|nr:hypothetical protein [Mycolicibacterium sp. BK634]MBB3752581.1 hypothetical protein [Mycolicibacterium sp. BK634]